jgi:hypothetical protein
LVLYLDEFSNIVYNRMMICLTKQVGAGYMALTQSCHVVAVIGEDKDI